MDSNKKPDDDSGLTEPLSSSEQDDGGQVDDEPVVSENNPFQDDPLEQATDDSLGDDSLELSDGDEEEATDVDDSLSTDDASSQTVIAVDSGDASQPESSGQAESFDEDSKAGKWVIGALLIIALGLGVITLLINVISDSNDDEVGADDDSVTGIVDNKADDWCQQAVVPNINEINVLRYGDSLRYNDIHELWPTNLQTQGDAKAILQDAIDNLFNRKRDGCTPVGVAYWRNILPHFIDADRVGVDNFNAGARIQAYRQEDSTRLGVVKEVIQRLNDCGDSSLIDLTPSNTKEVYLAAYTVNYKDIVFVRTPLSEMMVDEIDDEPNQGLKVIRCYFGKMEGNHDNQVNEAFISPTLRSLVFLDRPAGGQIVDLVTNNPATEPQPTPKPKDVDDVVDDTKEDEEEVIVVSTETTTTTTSTSTSTTTTTPKKVSPSTTTTPSTTTIPPPTSTTTTVKPPSTSTTIVTTTTSEPSQQNGQEGEEKTCVDNCDDNDGQGADDDNTCVTNCPNDNGQNIGDDICVVDCPGDDPNKGDNPGEVICIGDCDNGPIDTNDGGDDCIGDCSGDTGDDPECIGDCGQPPGGTDTGDPPCIGDCGTPPNPPPENPVETCEFYDTYGQCKGADPGVEGW